MKSVTGTEQGAIVSRFIDGDDVVDCAEVVDINFKPPRYLVLGDRMRPPITALGVLENTIG